MPIRRFLMSGRSIHESHRAATPLELFFDLIFVIAIAAASSNLHHSLAAHHMGTGLIAYFMAFFSIWWAWMNFTWFASAYDTDDTPYRLTTFLLLFGALVFAVGINDISDRGPAPIVPVSGYVIMRIAMVIHWLRASREHPENRIPCRRYAIGISVAQVGWVFWMAVPETYKFVVFLLIALFELLVPLFAEGKKLATNWHPHHIAERYGLMVIIVLGEGLLGTANTIAGLIQLETFWNGYALLLGMAAAGLIFALWWLYFELPWGKVLHENRTQKFGFVFGYSHLFVFASLAAVGSALELIADTTQQASLPPGTRIEHPVSPLFAISTLSAAIGVFLVSISCLRLILISNSRYNWYALAVAVVAVCIPVIAVWSGLGILWALVLSIAGIIAYITLCNWEKCTLQ
ncbi:MAG: low temperature requirement protein A [Mangrovibacterium sp.]